MKKTTPLLFVVPMITASSLTVMTGNAIAQSSDTTVLNPVIVTATRTARTADETIAPVTVITRHDIEATGAQNVPDVLRGTAGVDFSTNGAYGKNSGVFLRGTESDHVLILVDGVRMYSATLGTTAIQHLPLDQVERIEVLRGPRASLYGAEAIGGVIQIFTRRGNGPATVDAVVGFGSDSTKELGLGISGSSDGTRYNVRLSGADSEGIDVLVGAQTDDDPYDNTSISASVDHDISETASVGFSLLRSSGSTSFDNAFDTIDADNVADFTQQAASLHGRVDFTDAWTSSLRFSQGRDESDNFRSGTPSGTFNTKRNELAWQNDISVDDNHVLTLGLDYSDDEVSGTTTYDESSRDNLGIYAQWQGDYGNQSVIAAIRSDDNEQFGSFTTGNIDYSYAINDGLRITASAGRAYKAPTFNELYFPGFGNASLVAEESESFEVGIKGSLQSGSWGVRAFKTDIDNLITFDLATFLPGNIDLAEIRGIEADFSTVAGSWNLRGALTLLDPEDATTGKTLRRRAKETLRFDADRDVGKFSVGGSLIYQGKRFEDAANTMSLNSYVLANLRGSYRFNDTLSLEATVENLFDEEYSTAQDYREKGRSVFLRLRYRQSMK